MQESQSKQFGSYACVRSQATKPAASWVLMGSECLGVMAFIRVAGRA
jgi:hypothetical protein